MGLLEEIVGAVCFVGVVSGGRARGGGEDLGRLTGVLGGKARV